MTFKIGEVRKGIDTVSAKAIHVGATVGYEVNSGRGDMGDSVADLIGSLPSIGKFIGSLAPEEIVIPLSASNLIDDLVAETGVIFESSFIFRCDGWGDEF